ncbi:MAG: hypothetical protein QOE92_2171 [Chloroflexota bacterium]|jgi:lipoprotein-anchoring transpeptidase ErfK/SrfK|nr:hypothetical protein [Chloroflexota bacterium]
MLAIGATVRPALICAQIVITFAAANVGGVFAAVSYQNHEVQNAQAAIEAAHRDFQAQAATSIADGARQEDVNPFVAQEQELYGQPLPPATFFVDRQRLDALKDRATQVGKLTKTVQGVEAQMAGELLQQLNAALDVIRTDIKPATDVGIDANEFQAFVDQAARASETLRKPVDIQKALDEANARDAALKDMTAKKIAENSALENAIDSAKQWVANAQAALAKAQAIPVLRVSDNAAAVTALADRLAKATPGSGIGEYQDIAAGARGQAGALNNLVTLRQSAYDLLAVTRSHIQIAKDHDKDVSQDSANLDAAAQKLDVAGDLPSLTAAKAAIQAVKNSVDAKYFALIYGEGKVIVVSIIKQEVLALENGNVLLDTLAATGRTSLPTPAGVYNIFYKSSPYHMHSPWPRGNQYWYPDVDMKYAMEFIEGGYFIHDAPWRSRWGPGANNEGTGTHGCVNIPRDKGQMDFLYGWADIGTTVVVTNGDFGTAP